MLNAIYFYCSVFEIIFSLFGKFQNNAYGISSKAACLPADSVEYMTGMEAFNSPCANGLVFNNAYNFTVDLKYMVSVSIITEHFYLGYLSGLKII